MFTEPVPPDPRTFASSPPSLPADDRAIVAGLRRGDDTVLEALFRALHEPLVAFAVRYLDDRARAEEQVQELFLTLWRDRERLAISGSVRSYLFAALRNRMLNVRRRDRVEREWAHDESQDAVRVLHRAPVTPLGELETQELHATVAAAFEQLPERCRLAMHLRWREGMSYAEIAEVLGIGVKGVENQLARGLKALRDRLVPR